MIGFPKLALGIALSGVFALPLMGNRDDALPDISFNDNLAAAGRLASGTLTISLEVRKGRWFPLGKDHAPAEVLAFGPAGEPLTTPGPMLRVPLGTAMRVRVTNASETTVVVRGLSSRLQPVMDTLLLAPGATGEARFTADAEGTFYYWAGEPGRPMTGVPVERRRLYDDAQLNGAFIVDPPGYSPPRNERVLVLSNWFADKDSAGGPDFNTELFVINGRPWPHTERFTYQVGDSVHWRFINTTFDVHPLHLHGFYYRVDARGDGHRDTAYWPAQQRMVVTERMLPATTMKMVWSPDRPGGWVFHCHLTFHIIPNAQIGPHRLSKKDREAEILMGHPHQDPGDHVEKQMGGLMLGMYVNPPPGWKPADVKRRSLRLLVQSDSTPTDSVRRFGYILQDGAEPKPDSVRLPGSPLVVHRGEPTSIWVVNRTQEPTAIHWHGIELESLFDGVVGVGGYKGMPSPAVMPGDSFEVRMTPPRSGSFMYHTHVNDVRQMRSGLYAPLLVLEPGATWDRERDLVFLTGENREFDAVINGKAKPDTLTLTQGEKYRFRFMNITMAFPNVEYFLVRDGGPTQQWIPLAQDGFDLPPWRRDAVPARQQVTIGTTYDFEVTPRQAGNLKLELRGGAGALLVTQPIVVKKRS
jgi:FtsP/CotA-like multicopper oxidase with cupredoxin domain